MTTSHSARDRPRRSESLGSPPPPSPRRRSGEGSRNRRVPSPIPESEERVTVETNPSPPNRHPEGDRDLDSTPGGKQGPRLHARRDGPLEHGRRGLGTRRPASHTRRARTGQAPECLCRTEPRKRRGSPLGDTGRLRRDTVGPPSAHANTLEVSGHRVFCSLPNPPVTFWCGACVQSRFSLDRKSVV